MVNWDSNKEDTGTIQSIAKRANKLATEIGAFKYGVLDAVMDVTATHLNGCALKLKELLAADNSNFAHDVFGILRHVDRNTGKLGDCFIPRYAQ